MYQKLHHKLTLVFTCITGCILIAMSLSYQFLAEKQLKDNSIYTFSAEAEQFTADLGHQTVLTNDWLAKVASNGKYLIAIYDNETPISYSQNALSPTQLLDVSDALNYYEKNLLPNSLSYAKDQYFRETFSYKNQEGISYHACYFRTPKGSGTLSGILLFHKEQLTAQLNAQRIRLLFLNLGGILILFLFCYIYTKRLLLPIQTAHEKQTAFIAAASHELRTPLAVILSSLSAADAAKTEEKEMFLITAQKESKRMSSLLTDMLTLARADSQGFSIQPKPVELDTLLLDTCEAFEALAREKQISLTAILPEDILPPCNCDGSRIRQVISILISNGLTYGKAGGFLKVSLSHGHYGYEIQVTDNGVGIPDKAKEHIFDRFYRIESARSQKEHFGLGLCIAKEIVQAHHGTIEVKDTKGGGASFVVRIGRI